MTVLMVNVYNEVQGGWLFVITENLVRVVDDAKFKALFDCDIM